ncbi:YibE/F family protein [Alkalihalobacillus sp. 1P02AB]|uniref:YibE/F family protein n=1 Tax=Alkalihalobacillus sp. 1P02AB TaxID=3132260 RepID=UPI0039A7723F
MNMLVTLAIILFLLMIVIGGKQGLRSFIAIFLNLFVLLLTILFMTAPNADPILLTLIACAVVSCINLFYINGLNSKTITAFIATIITTVILLLFIIIITENTMIQGFGKEEIDELTVFSLHLGVDFVKIGAAVVIMSTIGAITDVAISISSPLREIYIHNHNINRRDLFLAGISIGKDILGTSTNTLFFAFFGAYLGLLIWFKELSYSIGEIANSKVFVAEMITILSAGIGVALIIPITSWITAYSLTKSGNKSKDTE